jgi:gamma-glutamyltranspeptidase/glutathione hydrolase
VFDKAGDFLLSVGSPGGPAIIGYVTQTVVAMLDGGKTPSEAIALPGSSTSTAPPGWKNRP